MSTTNPAVSDIVWAAQDERHTLIRQEDDLHAGNIAAEMKRHADALEHIESVFRLRTGQDQPEHVITSLPGSVRDKDGKVVPNEFYEPLRSYPLTAQCLVCQQPIQGQCTGGPIIWRHVPAAPAQ